MKPRPLLQVYRARPAAFSFSVTTHIIGIDETHAITINADQSTEPTDAD